MTADDFRAELASLFEAAADAGRAKVVVRGGGPAPGGGRLPGDEPPDAAVLQRDLHGDGRGRRGPVGAAVPPGHVRGDRVSVAASGMGGTGERGVKPAGSRRPDQIRYRCRAGIRPAARAQALPAAPPVVLDGASSGLWFDGWKGRGPPPGRYAVRTAEVAAPRTWLAVQGPASDRGRGSRNPRGCTRFLDGDRRSACAQAAARRG